MITLLDIKKPYPIELNGRRFQLLSKEDSGGSSIVYKAREDGNANDYFVIKEFFPSELSLRHKPDGTLEITKEKLSRFNDLIKRAEREAEIVNILRHNTNENNTPWFLSYSEPIPKNGTLYTIIATESGSILKKRIKDGYFKQMDFAYICDCVLKILDALEPIHKQGYLHLDIAPDNIHFSDLQIARMIDYNSAFCEATDKYGEATLTFKPGYSAAELSLKNRSRTKQPIVNPSTDLYSIAAIFFELLVGEPPKESVWSNPNGWYLSSGSGVLKGSTELLVKQTNQFLRKGISRYPGARFQSISEMRGKLKELIKLRVDYELVNNRKSPYAHFICRESELKQIDECLKTESYVFIEGIGGIGKSELVKYYAAKYGDNYDIIQFITFKYSIMETIADSLSLRGYDYHKYELSYPENEILSRIFEDKMICLDKYDRRTLIIIDNYNAAEDAHFYRLVSNNYKVIFTSREKHDGNVIEISQMTSNEDLLRLFSEYYAPAVIKPQDEGFIRDIISLVLGHTMTVMLIASAMRVHEASPADMLRRLQAGLDSEMMTKIAVNKEEISTRVREQVMYRHLINLFNMEGFSEDDEESLYLTHIMTNMAIVPYTGIAPNLLYKWALAELYHEDNSYYDLERLIKLRWIQFDKDSDLISLHHVISDIAWKTLEPDSEKCVMLLNKFLYLHEENRNNRTRIQHVLYCTHMLELPCKRINDETDLALKLLFKYASLNYTLRHYDISLEIQDKLIKILISFLDTENIGTENVDTKDTDSNSAYYESCLGEAYLNKAIFHAELVEYDNALASFEKSIDILNSLKKRQELAVAYMSRGVVYENMNAHDLAMSDKNMSIYMFEQLEAEGFSDVRENCAIAYMNRGATFASMNKYNEALSDLEKSVNMLERIIENGGAINEDNLARARLSKSKINSKLMYSQNKDSLTKSGETIYNRNAASALLSYAKKQKERRR